MKTMTLTVANRPEYLERMLQSLRRCQGVEDYVLYVGAEPMNTLCVQLVQNIDWMAVHLRVHGKKLGIRHNPYETINRAFREGSEFNLYLEDDIVLSPDAVQLANWYTNLPDFEDYLALCLLRYDSDPTRPTDILYGTREGGTRFSALGLGMSRKSWIELFAPHWFNDARSKELLGETNVGWDYTVTTTLRTQPELQFLVPALSRSNHIGRDGGVHCLPKWHDEMFADLPINEDPEATNYALVPK